MTLKHLKLVSNKLALTGIKLQFKTPLKPLAVSAGGKSRCLEFFKSTIPNISNFNGYVEPFFSTAGALYSNIANQTTISDMRINDNSPERIHLLNTIKKYPVKFVASCETYAEEWNSIEDAEARKDWYYQKRAEYQTMRMGKLETMALLYVLQRLSFSGIYRVNKITKRFYGAVGHRNRDLKINLDLIFEWSRQLQKTKISCGDYHDMSIAKKSSLIFCDPPYRNSEVGFGYQFGDKELIELIKWCQKMATLGHTVLLANLDNDNFITNKLTGNFEKHVLNVKFTAGRTKRAERTKRLSALCCFVFKPLDKKAANDNYYDLENKLEIKEQILVNK